MRYRVGNESEPRQFSIDTASRIISGMYVVFNGKPRLVTSAMLAPTAHRPARMAITVAALSGLFDEFDVIHVDAGETFPMCSLRVAGYRGFGY